MKPSRLNFLFLGLIIILGGCGIPRQKMRQKSKVTTVSTISLAQDTLWEGEILVDGVVTVPSGVTLTIKPGTIVKFKPAPQKTYGAGNGIIVNGTLVARGSKKAMIIFTSAAKSPARGDWNDIFFIVSEGENNILDYCVIRYANIGVHGHFCKLVVQNCFLSDNWRAFQFQESEMAISNNQMLDNNFSMRFRDSDVIIANNRIANSYSGIESLRSTVKFRNNQVRNCYMTSIKFRETDLVYTNNLIEKCRRGLQINDSSQVNVTDSDFINNYESGLLIQNSLVHLKRNNITGNGGDGVSVKGSGLNVNYNNIINNGKYAIDNESKSAINAQYNWWGSTDILVIAGQIYDFFDQKELGKVDFALFLYEPIRQIKNHPAQEPSL